MPEQATSQTRPAQPEIGALGGIRVLDLSNVLAGPFCAYQLALLGAEVIKIEAPEKGDLARELGADAELNRELMGTSFLAQNGGKKSITINLKSAVGRGVFLDLVKTADVLVENFRPGVMQRLGLSYAELKPINPRLIYCAISGFGQTGPMREAPAYDQIVQGVSGIMSVTGDAQSAPLRVGYPIADTIGGITAAFAIVSALVGRMRTENGTFIDVSMLEATISTMGWIVSNYLIAGKSPLPMGNENFTAAPSGTFNTASGLLNISANKQEQFFALAELINRPDLKTDARFENREDRKSNRVALNEQIDVALRAKTAEEWEIACRRVGVPAGLVLSVPDALALAQVKERGLVRTVNMHESIGRQVSTIRSGFKMSDGQPGTVSCPPRLGEHTDDILSSLGATQEQIEKYRTAGAV